MTLISVEKNIQVPEWSLSWTDLAGAGKAHWSIHKKILHGGRQEGVEVITVDNGAMAITVIPTRGMNIWEARCGDLRLGWNSPVQEIVHPAYIHLTARSGLGWLAGFGEWINRCGLESIGPPGPDEILDNTGETVTTELTLHGQISYIPAREVVVSIDADPPHTIRVRGVVDETMMFGPKLRLITEISTVPDSTSLTITDEIVNRGADPQEMQILYHCNFGPPLLSDGTRVVLAARKVTPRDARAAEDEGVENFDRYGPPVAGFREQVFFIELLSDPAGESEVLMKNPPGDRGASIRFSVGELPAFTLWKNTTALDNGYVVGLEPGTSYSDARSRERKAGRVILLPPGGSYRAGITVTAHLDRESVEASEKRIQAIKSK